MLEGPTYGEGLSLDLSQEVASRTSSSWGLGRCGNASEFFLRLAVLVRPEFSSVSKHQPVERDLAVIVSESVTHSALMAAINSAGISQLLRSATLFDVYRPQQAGASMQLGEKSLAVRLVLSSDEATLTEEQIDAAVQAVLARLQIDLGARLRA